LVQADLEGTGYATGAVDLCAAGIGAPHIRQRLWFVAERVGVTNSTGSQQRWEGSETPRQRCPIESGGGIDRVADASSKQYDGARNRGQARGIEYSNSRAVSGVADARLPEPQGWNSTEKTFNRIREERDIEGNVFTSHGAHNSGQPGPTNGFWSSSDWLFCRDGKWRPVEPGTFPLAHGATQRVGRLRAYGNAINAEAAEAFIEAYMTL
ncbi:MAG: DNA cytosine methyltransferase, partial [Gammaproteobacteria bacterium]|nr:DNA cytosine methyltransferase [Gammaproteobacteria bacterium]